MKGSYKKKYRQRPKLEQDDEIQLFQSLSRPTKKLKVDQEVKKIKYGNAYQKIDFIPQYQLSMEDMNSDPIELLMKLQKQYYSFGAIKLITPKDWNPPFCFLNSPKRMTTRIQPLHKLQYGKIHNESILNVLLWIQGFEQKKESQTLKSFHDMGKQFQRKYKFKFEEKGSTREGKLENQFWSIVKGPSKQAENANPKKYKVNVEYAADLPANKYNSGFPLQSNTRTFDGFFQYSSNLFNLNNLSKCPTSLLRISDDKKQHIQGITIPWVYVGMQFSTFCWHVQDCLINSLNYNHKGNVKVWYIVPQSEKSKFQSYFQSKNQGKNALGKLTYLIDPLELKAQGIQIYKVFQKPKQFVFTFFSTYHCGFSLGFNIGQAINFVSEQSLKYIQNQSLSRKKENPSRSLFCYEWIIYENYEKDQAKCSKIVKASYKAMLIKQQKAIKKALQDGWVKKYSKFESNSKYDRYSCHSCQNYVYLSFVECLKCHKGLCFEHLSECCSDRKFKLMIREPNKDRLKLLTLCEEVK